MIKRMLYLLENKLLLLAIIEFIIVRKIFDWTISTNEFFYKFHLLLLILSIIVYTILRQLFKIKFEYSWGTVLPIWGLLFIVFHLSMVFKSNNCKLLTYKNHVVHATTSGGGRTMPYLVQFIFKEEIKTIHYPYTKLGIKEDDLRNGFYDIRLGLKKPLDGYYIIKEVQFVKRTEKESTKKLRKE